MANSLFCVCAVAVFLWRSGSHFIAWGFRSGYASVADWFTTNKLGCTGQTLEEPWRKEAGASQLPRKVATTATPQPAQGRSRLPRKLLASKACINCMRPAADKLINNQKLCCSKCQANTERQVCHTEHCNLRTRGCEIALEWSEENE